MASARRQRPAYVSYILAVSGRLAFRSVFISSASAAYPEGDTRAFLAQEMDACTVAGL